MAIINVVITRYNYHHRQYYSIEYIHKSVRGRGSRAVAQPHGAGGMHASRGWAGRRPAPDAAWRARGFLDVARGRSGARAAAGSAATRTTAVIATTATVGAAAATIGRPAQHNRGARREPSVAPRLAGAAVAASRAGRTGGRARIRLRAGAGLSRRAQRDR